MLANTNKLRYIFAATTSLPTSFTTLTELINLRTSVDKTRASEVSNQANNQLIATTKIVPITSSEITDIITATEIAQTVNSLTSSEMTNLSTTDSLTTFSLYTTTENSIQTVTTNATKNSTDITSKITISVSAAMKSPYTLNNTTSSIVATEMNNSTMLNRTIFSSEMPSQATPTAVRQSTITDQTAFSRNAEFPTNNQLTLNTTIISGISTETTNLTIATTSTNSTTFTVMANFTTVENETLNFATTIENSKQTTENTTDITNNTDMVTESTSAELSNASSIIETISSKAPTEMNIPATWNTTLSLTDSSIASTEMSILTTLDKRSFFTELSTPVLKTPVTNFTEADQTTFPTAKTSTTNGQPASTPTTISNTSTDAKSMMATPIPTSSLTFTVMINLSTTENVSHNSAIKQLKISIYKKVIAVINDKQTTKKYRCSYYIVHTLKDTKNLIETTDTTKKSVTEMTYPPQLLT